jgi:hypothetical protein
VSSNGTGGALQIVTISGRTIRKEALASPLLSDVAIRRIQDLLDRVPDDAIKRCEQFRKQRRNGAVTV